MSIVVEKVEMVERGLTGPKGDKGATGDVTPELLTAKNDAETAATAAGTSATEAAGSATAAATSETTAGNSATAAGTSATAAAGSESNAGNSATAASNSASAAATSETNAAGSATAAGNSATAAAGSATSAATSETNAAASAVTASAAVMGVQNHLPTAAEFEALAANRRNQFAGSGFVEWGRHATGTTPINDGLWNDSSNMTILLAGRGISGVGVSKSDHPLLAVNGYALKIWGVDWSSSYNFNRFSFPPAPATSALLDRQDLVFLEAWHEDISEKDFVYPYGNTQYAAASYMCPDGTVLTCVNGSFSGYGTYSLFGNWQAPSALIGRGVKWSTMTDAQKQAFAADPQNNMYLDEDKIIQVRYRVRVVEGLGSSWLNVKPTTGRLYYDTINKVRVKASGTSITADLGLTADYYEGAQAGAPAYDKSLDNGMWQGVGNNWNNKTALAYNGKAYALPIALVQRRNSGAWHPVFNPNGSAKCLNVDGTTAKNWYETDRSYISGQDCFDFKTGGSIASAGSGRPDSLYYDAIYEQDVLDLRNSAHKVADLTRCLEREFNKLVAGATRGWEKGNQLWHVAMGRGYNAAFDFIFWRFPSGAFSPSDERRLEAYGYFWAQKTDGTLEKLPLQAGTGGVLLGGECFVNGADGTGDTSTNYTNNIMLPIVTSGTAYKSPTSSKTLLHCDIIGDPENYPQSWKDNGIAGTPLLLAEDGVTSLIPDGTSKTWKLSRKVKTFLLALRTLDNGATWTIQTSNWSTDMSGTANARTVALASTEIYLFFYLTEASPLALAANAEVLALGDVWASNNNASEAQGVFHTIGKIPVATSDPRIIRLPLSGKNINAAGGNLMSSSSAFGGIYHSAMGLSGVSPAVKLLPYLTRANGKAFLQVLYKEMIHNGSSWGDDSKFNMIDNESTTTDLNAQTVKIGQKRVELPYFIGAGE